MSSRAAAISVLALMLTDCGPAIARPTPSCPPPFGDVRDRFGQDGGIAITAPELLRSRAVPLPALATQLCVVEYLVHTPAPDVVFVWAAGAWAPIRYQLNLVEEWVESLAAAVAGVDDPGNREPIEVARALTQALIALEPYAVVLSNRDSVPVDREASDVYRDALRHLGSAEEVRQALLAPLGAAEPSPPTFTAREGKLVLEFWTWSYFGGDVDRWEVQLDPPVNAVRHPIATGVGSWDFLM
jgi:hypothetical protein